MTKEERRARGAACRAVDFMGVAPVEGDEVARRKGMKVLRPPPGRIADRVVTASRLALVQDRRAGVVHDPKPTKVREKVKASASVFDDLDDRAQRGWR